MKKQLIDLLDELHFKSEITQETEGQTKTVRLHHDDLINVYGQNGDHIESATECLEWLKQKGGIISFDFNNPNEPENWNINYFDYPELFPGIFVIKIETEFRKVCNSLKRIVDNNISLNHEPVIKFNDDGSLVDIANDILIHKYFEKTRAFGVLEFFYQNNNLDLVSWDEIAEFLEGGEPTVMESKTIYDVIININKHAVNTIGKKIILNNGKHRYKRIY